MDVACVAQSATGIAFTPEGQRHSHGEKDGPKLPVIYRCLGWDFFFFFHEKRSSDSGDVQTEATYRG